MASSVRLPLEPVAAWLYAANLWQLLDMEYVTKV